VNYIAKVLLGVSCAVAANATPFAFDFASSGGTVSGTGFSLTRTYQMAGVTVKVTAFGLTGDSNTTFQQGQLGQFNTYGLGVCDQKEGVNCNSPEHRVDNHNWADFVLFEFSNPVNLSSMSFKNVYNDSDTTYYYGNLTASVSGKTLGQLAGIGLTGVQNNDSNISSGDRTFNLNINGPVNALLIGGRVGTGKDYNDDYFKISGLAGSTGVPEPATLSLMGGALLALGLIRRKKN
jgi:hypothetical protein